MFLTYRVPGSAFLGHNNFNLAAPLMKTVVRNNRVMVVLSRDRHRHYRFRGLGYNNNALSRPVLLFLVLLLLADSIGTVSAFFSSSPQQQQQSLPPPSSLLTETRWKIRLDVGLQPGTWMPKRFPGWAESGARLGLDVDVQFTATPSSIRESLVGPKDETFRIKVSPNPARFVSELGQQEARFATVGGWCIQRPANRVKNSRGDLVKPEGLLRFWLDCETGAKRQDAEIRPGTRIFFTTGVWDDPALLRKRDDEYRDVLQKLQTTADATRKERQRQREDGGGGNALQELQSYQKLLGDARSFENRKRRKETLEKELPPPGASVAGNGVQIAPTGSLVIKGNSIPDWLPGSEYLILGTFSAKALDAIP